MDVAKFFTTSLPPRYGHQLNWLESMGNVCLFLFTSAIGAFSIKDTNMTTCLCAIAVIFFSLPLTILGTILKGIGYAWPHKEILATDETHVITHPMMLTQCYELSQALKRIFLENGLVRMQNGEEQPSFVMMSGTAIGAVRHGGIVPWDDDCDFALFKEDEEKFLSLKNVFEKEQIEIHPMRIDSTYKLRFTNEKIKEKYGEEGGLQIGDIDLFIWSKMSDGSYTYDTALIRSRRVKEYFSAKDIERGFKMIPFGPPEKGLTLPLLKEPAEYLSRFYGKNYMDFGIATHGHFSLDFGKWGSVQVVVFKLGTHYFKIKKWKGIPGAWI